MQRIGGSDPRMALYLVGLHFQMLLKRVAACKSAIAIQ